jgi:hypothetical protein
MAPIIEAVFQPTTRVALTRRSAGITELPRGEMKRILKGDKYSIKEESKNA